LFDDPHPAAAGAAEERGSSSNVAHCSMIVEPFGTMVVVHSDARRIGLTPPPATPPSPPEQPPFKRLVVFANLKAS
jgi:hypothetical protein